MLDEPHGPVDGLDRDQRLRGACSSCLSALAADAIGRPEASAVRLERVGVVLHAVQQSNEVVRQRSQGEGVRLKQSNEQL